MWPADRTLPKPVLDYTFYLWSQTFITNTKNCCFRFRDDKDGGKYLPCITVCPFKSFKTRQFHYKGDDYLQNTFTKEDIFEQRTLDSLSNTTIYDVKESLTFFLGICFTICHKLKGGISENTIYGCLYFKKSMNIKIYFHVPGEEFWLNGYIRFPSNKVSIDLMTNNSEQISSVLVALSEYQERLTKQFLIRLH